MSFDGRAVANYVLDFCEAKNRAISPFSLQKIVYFCHVWTLIEKNIPLIKHPFEAWEHGPVLPYLYRDFKVFGDRRITSRAMGLDKRTGDRRIEPYDFDVEIESLLQRVIDFYSQLRSSELYLMSHASGGPWDNVWKHKGAANPGMKISDELIKEFYGGRGFSSRLGYAQ